MRESAARGNRKRRAVPGAINRKLRMDSRSGWRGSNSAPEVSPSLAVDSRTSVAGAARRRSAATSRGPQLAGNFRGEIERLHEENHEQHQRGDSGNSAEQRNEDAKATHAGRD